MYLYVCLKIHLPIPIFFRIKKISILGEYLLNRVSFNLSNDLIKKSLILN